MTDGPADPTDGPEVGSLGEEAAKLLQALQGWAGRSGADDAGAATSAEEAAATTWRRFDEHIATGSAECRYCPVCQVISVVRATPPEVRQHLASAATSVMHAAAAILATTVPEPDERRRDGPVERIDLDEDGEQGHEEWEDDR